MHGGCATTACSCGSNLHVCECRGPLSANNKTLPAQLLSPRRQCRCHREANMPPSQLAIPFTIKRSLRLQTVRNTPQPNSRATLHTAACTRAVLPHPLPAAVLAQAPGPSSARHCWPAGCMLGLPALSSWRGVCCVFEADGVQPVPVSHGRPLGQQAAVAVPIWEHVRLLSPHIVLHTVQRAATAALLSSNSRPAQPRDVLCCAVPQPWRPHPQLAAEGGRRLTTPHPAHLLCYSPGDPALLSHTVKAVPDTQQTPGGGQHTLTSECRCRPLNTTSSL